MTTWHVWTDGSCHHGVAQTPKRVRGWGGWAAIVEHGSDGFILRGREQATTNVRMELRAAIEGLRAVPADAPVVLHADCTVVISVRDGVEQGTLRENTNADSPLWRELGAELDLRRVTIDLLGRGPRDDLHRRAHVIAGSEARAGLRELPLNVVPYRQRAKVVRKRMIRHQLAELDSKPVRSGTLRLRHLPACTNGFCMYGCPVWRHRHPGVHGEPLGDY